MDSEVDYDVGSYQGKALPSSVVVQWTPPVDNGSIASWTGSESTPKAMSPSSVVLQWTPPVDNGSIVSWTESESTPKAMSPSSVVQWTPPVANRAVVSWSAKSRPALTVSSLSVACNELEDHPVVCRTPSRGQRVALPSKSLRQQQTPATTSMKKKIRFSSVDVVPAKNGKPIS